MYGQNGSGKTVLINALELLKFILTGKPIPAKFADYIHIDATSASLKYEFKVYDHTKKITYSAFYEVSFCRDIHDDEHNTDQLDSNVNYKVGLFDEVLSCSYESSQKKVKRSRLIDTRTSNDTAFIPATKYEMLAGKDKETLTRLLVAKKLARATSRSFYCRTSPDNKTFPDGRNRPFVPAIF